MLLDTTKDIKAKNGLFACCWRITLCLYLVVFPIVLLLDYYYAGATATIEASEACAASVLLGTAIFCIVITMCYQRTDIAFMKAVVVYVLFCVLLIMPLYYGVVPSVLSEQEQNALGNELSDAVSRYDLDLINYSTDINDDGFIYVYCFDDNNDSYIKAYLKEIDNGDYVLYTLSNGVYSVYGKENAQLVVERY